MPQNRVILSEKQAIAIFKLRSAMSMVVSGACFVSELYGISEKTVRDIWKQRTWAHTTSSLAEYVGPMTRKKVGRPIGSKDIRPRKQKLGIPTELEYTALKTGERSHVGDERGEQSISIDDQLHMWAQCNSEWIINAALSLNEDLN
jgi:hypothetical protein